MLIATSFLLHVTGITKEKLHTQVDESVQHNHKLHLNPTKKKKTKKKTKQNVAHMLKKCLNKVTLTYIPYKSQH